MRCPPLLSLLIFASFAAASPSAQRLAPPPLPTKGKLAGMTGLSAEQGLAGVLVEASVDFTRIGTYEFWRNFPYPKARKMQLLSDQRGYFSIEVERGFEYAVQFKKKGYHGEKGIVYAERPFLARLLEGPAPRKAKEELGPVRLAGRVFDSATGKPIQGARLRAPWGTELLAESDAKGEFRVRHRGELEKDLLVVLADGYRIGSVPKSAWAKVGETPKSCDVKLEAGVEVTGRIVDGHGKPLSGLRVLCGTDVTIAESSTYGEVCVPAITDGDGRYRFSSLGKGWRYWVRTVLPRGVPLELGQGMAVLDRTELGSVRTGPGFEVRGLVRGDDGRPLPDARVHVLRLFSEKLTQKQIVRNTPSYPVDHQGYYRIAGLAPGRYELCFYKDKFEHKVRVVEPPRNGSVVRLDLALDKGRKISGTVVDAAGKPIGGALLRALVWADDEYFPIVPYGNLNHNGRFIAGYVRVLTRDDGTFLLERVRSRVPIRLLCMKEGYKKAVLRVEKDGKDRGLRIQLSK